jgi:hypothetical protein
VWSHDTRQGVPLETHQRQIEVVPIRIHTIINCRSHIAYFVTNTLHHPFLDLTMTHVLYYTQSHSEAR